MILHTKYQGSRLCGFRQVDFFMMLPIKAYVKPVTPEVGPLLAQGYNLNKCGRGLLDDTYIPKVKALGLVVSDKKIFSCCSQYKPM